MTRAKPPGGGSGASDESAPDPAQRRAPAPDYLTDFPEEFEQRPDGPPRDLARRARRGDARAESSAADPGEGEAASESAAAAKVRAMRQRIEKLRD